MIEHHKADLAIVKLSTGVHIRLYDVVTSLRHHLSCRTSLALTPSPLAHSDLLRQWQIPPILLLLLGEPSRFPALLLLHDSLLLGLQSAMAAPASLTNAPRFVAVMYESIIPAVILLIGTFRPIIETSF